MNSTRKKVKKFLKMEKKQINTLLVNDVFLLIFSMVNSPLDLFSFKCVCKKWNHLVKHIPRHVRHEFYATKKFRISHMEPTFLYLHHSYLNIGTAITSIEVSYHQQKILLFWHELYPLFELKLKPICRYMQGMDFETKTLIGSEQHGPLMKIKRFWSFKTQKHLTLNLTQRVYSCMINNDPINLKITIQPSELVSYLTIINNTSTHNGNQLMISVVCAYHPKIDGHTLIDVKLADRNKEWVFKLSLLELQWSRSDPICVKLRYKIYYMNGQPMYADTTATIQTPNTIYHLIKNLITLSYKFLKQCSIHLFDMQEYTTVRWIQQLVEFPPFVQDTSQTQEETVLKNGFENIQGLNV